MVPSDELDGAPSDEDDDIDVSDVVSAGQRLASVKNKSPDVTNLFKRWKRGDLNLQPTFQRYDVWTDKIRSVLIESILLELPIPTIYLAEMQDGTFVVVDGQQRLVAIFRYLDGGYALGGLKALSRHNGKRFSDLPEALRTRIEDRALEVTEIYKETDPRVKFSLFERLNRGSVKLNDQELRNCIYRGSYNDFVNRLADNPVLKRSLRLKGSARHPRMVDAELTLRFLAFFKQTYLSFPDKKTSEFLNKQMEYGRAPDLFSEADLKKQEKAFAEALQSAHHVYGDNIFRRFRPGTLHDQNGSWEPRLNRALMDVVLGTFAQFTKSQIAPHSDAIREATITLMSNSEFGDLISHTISSRERVRLRFEKFQDAVKPLITTKPKDQTRGFRHADKLAFFKTDSTCAQCGNAIMTIDDAHMDHATPHASGGRTALRNARLTHQFCNQSKGRKDSLPAKKMSQTAKNVRAKKS